ncbi:hypothetical protein TSOC_009463 [Tetrabaena socialis]|uniref:SET domain-containing protein n=1 Tax=Tetrabaena socialis TaxID=47790 RepID=A0A2J7ZVU6_9CHLO|nr:hypothetical protein TSOC_009463 [Tetrabaena socialis]|eukprot:PNH04379.1 hypothetical protein TSOC_009463 [Tetrabaena socialis]
MYDSPRKRRTDKGGQAKRGDDSTATCPDPAPGASTAGATDAAATSPATAAAPPAGEGACPAARGAAAALEGAGRGGAPHHTFSASPGLTAAAPVAESHAITEAPVAWGPGEPGREVGGPAEGAEGSGHRPEAVGAAPAARAQPPGSGAAAEAEALPAAGAGEAGLEGAAEEAPPAAEAELLRWLAERGAQVGVAIGRSSGGVRGLYAAAAVARGAVLARIPLSAAIALGSADETAPELAVQLLRERYRARPRYGPYFDVLPPPPPASVEDAAAAAAAPTTTAPTAAAATAPAAAASARPSWQPSCVEELQEEAVAALLGADLRRLAAQKREWMRQVWSGAASVRLPLARAVPRRQVGLAEFAWATCMVTSRSISGPGGSLLLIPLIDLANHCTGG